MHSCMCMFLGVCLCVYVCMCVYMWLCVCVCVCVCVYVCVCVCASECMFATCMRMYFPLCVCLCVRMCCDVLIMPAHMLWLETEFNSSQQSARLSCRGAWHDDWPASCARQLKTPSPQCSKDRYSKDNENKKQKEHLRTNALYIHKCTCYTSKLVCSCACVCTCKEVVCVCEYVYTCKPASVPICLYVIHASKLVCRRGRVCKCCM